MLLMPPGRPDHSLPPQTQRGHRESWRREEKRGRRREGRTERGQADKVETRKQVVIDGGKQTDRDRQNEVSGEKRWQQTNGKKGREMPGVCWK